MKEKKPKLKIVEYKNKTETYRKINGKYKMIHIKWSDGDERWYDKNGNIIHEKWSDGTEYWYNEEGNVIDKKKNIYKSDNYPIIRYVEEIDMKTKICSNCGVIRRTEKKDICPVCGCPQYEKSK